MDELDKKILSILKKNSRTPFVAIAEKTGLTEGAIRLRVNKLLKEGTIKKFTIISKDSIKGIVLIKTSTRVSTTNIVGKIKQMGVEIPYETSGTYEIICFVEANSVKELNNTVEKIRQVKGVEDTTTCMDLKQ